MLNDAHLKFLKELLGNQGIYIETVRAHPFTNSGVKTLFLKRAIECDCEAFLLHLDKLYIPENNAAHLPTNIELIRSLKTINDLCHNNEVKYDVHGVRRALPHYFKALGELRKEDENELASYAAQLIHREIIRLAANNADSTLLRTRYLLDEPTMPACNQWRFIMDLPLTQVLYTTARRVIRTPTRPAPFRPQHEPIMYRQPALNERNDDSSSEGDEPYSPTQRESPVETALPYPLFPSTPRPATAPARERILSLLREQELITAREARNITDEQFARVELTFSLLLSQTIRFNQLITFNEQSFSKIVPLIDLLQYNYVTCEEVLRLPPKQFFILSKTAIIDLVLEEKLTIEEAITLNDAQVRNAILMHSLILENKFTIEEAVNLTEEQHFAFSQPLIYQAFEAGEISKQRVLTMKIGIINLLQNEKITLFEALFFTETQVRNVLLMEPFILQNMISAPEVFHLTADQIYVFSHPPIVAAVKDGELQMRDALRMRRDQADSFLGDFQVGMRLG